MPPAEWPPPGSLWAVLGGTAAAVAVKLPEWIAASRRRRRKEDASVVVAEIEDRADQRLGLYNEVQLLWKKLNEQQAQMTLIQAGREQEARSNFLLREENKSLRMLVVRLIADVHKLRLQLGLEGPDPAEYPIPPPTVA